MTASLLMTVEEAAKELGVHPKTIVALVNGGNWIGSRKAGGRYIISRAAFRRLYIDGIVDDATTTPRNPFLRSVPTRQSA